MIADVNEPLLDNTRADLDAMGCEVLAVATDVRDSGAIACLRDACLDRFGRADLLFNNAGVLSTGNCWEVSEQEWLRVMEVNLWGTIHAVRAFVPGMIERGRGHIVNISSMAGLTAGAGVAPYTVSKHGVVALSECLALEFTAAQLPLKVSVVCPGAVSTGIAHGLAQDGTGVPGILNRTLREVIGQGMKPDELATIILDAVDKGKFWALTHPEIAPAVERRMRNILSGEAPALLT